MKRAMFLLIAVALVAVTTGCQSLGGKKSCGCGDCASGCDADCEEGGTCNATANRPLMRPLRHRPNNVGPPAGGPTAQITYPYYINKSPRDFLAGREPDIGR